MPSALATVGDAAIALLLGREGFYNVDARVSQAVNSQPFSFDARGIASTQ